MEPTEENLLNSLLGNCQLLVEMLYRSQTLIYYATVVGSITNNLQAVML